MNCVLIEFYNHVILVFDITILFMSNSKENVVIYVLNVIKYIDLY